jgi:hypothetical protein
MSVEADEPEARYIPAEVRRLVLLESGHACAIPTCQFPATEFAHIEPYATVKKHDPANIIALCPNHHYLYDQKKQIDRKSMRAYKLKLQFLNKRYTKYELRLLTVLAEKPYVLASGEIETMGLLRDGLIRNAKTLLSQSIQATDDISGIEVFREDFVIAYAACLTEKGQEFIAVWKSQSEELLDVL